MTKLMNLQGQLFTEQEAKEFYGERYETAILEVVEVNGLKLKVKKIS